MRYRTEDGRILDPERAVKTWREGTRWNGSNHISLATGSQWDHEELHLSPKGTWWIEHWSQWEGRTPSARVVTPEEACRWLLANEYDPEDDGFPEELRKLVAQVLP